MKFSVDSLGGETETFDLDDLTLEWSVTDADTLSSLITMVVARYAVKSEVAFDSVWAGVLTDDMDNELDMGPGDRPEVWSELAKLYIHLETERHDGDMILACISNVGWKWFDFDNFDDAREGYVGEFDGDHEAFALNRMENYGESIPDHMEPYFDFEAYGKDIVKSYSEVEWNGTTYLFDQ